MPVKDYYYILGVAPEATAVEIKKAHRKLSFKFHPDKNKGDEFFSERFKEIQEAYETLIDPSKRDLYDIRRKRQYQPQDTETTATDPVIEYFFANKITFYSGEEVTFSWKTRNSDKVIFLPFGDVPPSGQRTYRIKYEKDENLTFKLIAKNAKTSGSTVAFVVLQPTDNPVLRIRLAFIVMIVVLLLLFLVFQVIPTLFSL